MPGSSWKLLERLLNNAEAAEEGALSDVNMAVAADVGPAIEGSPTLRLMGYVARESAAVAGAASADIVHGATAAGDLVYAISLAADGVSELWFGPVGIACPNGVSINHLLGTLDIVLFYKTT